MVGLASPIKRSSCLPKSDIYLAFCYLYLISSYYLIYHLYFFEISFCNCFQTVTSNVAQLFAPIKDALRGFLNILQSYF